MCRSYLKSVAHNRKTAYEDLHNVFCCEKNLNHLRGCLAFGQWHPSASLLQNVGCKATLLPTVQCAGHDNYIDSSRQLFLVNPRYRGLVARAILHMGASYGLAVDRVVEGGLKTLYSWHENHPPEPTELLHNYVVYQLQNTTNRFITGETDSGRLFQNVLKAFKASKT